MQQIFNNKKNQLKIEIIDTLVDAFELSLFIENSLQLWPPLKEKGRKAFKVIEATASIFYVVARYKMDLNGKCRNNLKFSISIENEKFTVNCSVELPIKESSLIEEYFYLINTLQKDTLNRITADVDALPSNNHKGLAYWIYLLHRFQKTISYEVTLVKLDIQQVEFSLEHLFR